MRFHVNRDDCLIEGKTVRLWYGDRNVSPTVIVKANELVTGPGPYTVTGTCGEPVVDGVSRGVRINYYVEVTNATVTSH